MAIPLIPILLASLTYAVMSGPLSVSALSAGGPAAQTPTDQDLVDKLRQQLGTEPTDQMVQAMRDCVQAAVDEGFYNDVYAGQCAQDILAQPSATPSVPPEEAVTPPMAAEAPTGEPPMVSNGEQPDGNPPSVVPGNTEVAPPHDPLTCSACTPFPSDEMDPEGLSTDGPGGMQVVMDSLADPDKGPAELNTQGGCLQIALITLGLSYADALVACAERMNRLDETQRKLQQEERDASRSVPAMEQCRQARAPVTIATDRIRSTAVLSALWVQDCPGEQVAEDQAAGDSARAEQQRQVQAVPQQSQATDNSHACSELKAQAERLWATFTLEAKSSFSEAELNRIAAEYQRLGCTFQLSGSR